MHIGAKGEGYRTESANLRSQFLRISRIDSLFLYYKSERYTRVICVHKRGTGKGGYQACDIMRAPVCIKSIHILFGAHNTWKCENTS